MSYSLDKELMDNIIREVLEEEAKEKQYKLDNPEPECSEPDWVPNKAKCNGCVVRYSDTHERQLGCKYCDEYWDIPELTK